MESKQYVVVVGPPFESQTMYGPFDSFDEAAIWTEKNCSGVEYNWIVTLWSKESVL